MKGCTCVVFDLDDVLLDTESNLDWLYRVFCRTLDSHNINVTDENIEKIHSKNLHRFSEICKEFGIPDRIFWKTRNNFYIEEKIKAIKNKEISAFTDIESLYKLKKKYRLAIVSDSPQEIVEFFVEEYSCKELFECVIGRGSDLKDLKNLKPSSFPYTKLLENIQCKDLFYVGDSKKDREFAKNNGMKFIFLDRNKNRDFNDLDKVVSYLLSL